MNRESPEPQPRLAWRDVGGQDKVRDAIGMPRQRPYLPLEVTGRPIVSGKAVALVAVATFVIVAVAVAIAGKGGGTALLAGAVAAPIALFVLMLVRGMTQQRDHFSRAAFVPPTPWRETDSAIPSGVTELLRRELGDGQGESVAWSKQGDLRVDLLSWTTAHGVHRPVFHVPLRTGLPPFALEPVIDGDRYVMQANDDDPAEVDALALGPFTNNPGVLLSDSASAFIVCPWTTNEGVAQFIAHPFDEVLDHLLDAEADFAELLADEAVGPPDVSAPPPTPAWDAAAPADYSTLHYDDDQR